MVPIGIVTRNRVAYLDVTLRSLSASTLPEGVPVVVYDDASNDRATQAYLTTNKPVPVPRSWPQHKTWRNDLGLSVVNDHDEVPKGIKGKVKVHRLGSEPLGVVEASCEAIRRLLAIDTEAPGVILLQDDVVFNADWYNRLVSTADSYQFEQPLGILAGIKLNQHFEQLKGLTPQPPVVQSGITAQCLYVTRSLVDNLDMFKQRQTITQKFDDTLKKRAQSNGYWAGCIVPFVCQHIGVQSLVRPKRGWHRGKTGRVGHYSRPPYVMSRSVKQF